MYPRCCRINFGFYSSTLVDKEPEELATVNDLTIEPAKDEDICLTSEEKNNKINSAVTGAEATDKPTVKADKQVVVQLDADGNKIADEYEFSATYENVKAMNQNTEEGAPEKVTDKEKSTTTVTDKVKPGATVKITSADGKTDLTPADGVKVDQDGYFTAEITKQEVGTEIKVTATEGGEKESVLANPGNTSGKDLKETLDKLIETIKEYNKRKKYDKNDYGVGLVVHPIIIKFENIT